jgi:serine protease
MSRSTLSAGACALAAVVAAAAALPDRTHAASRPVKTVSTLRVMLNPATSPPGVLSEPHRARLERLAGMPVALAGTTRTGALELALGGPRSEGSMADAAARLRSDRAVLWAEVATVQTVVAKSKLEAKAAQAPGRKLLVRLADGADPVATLLRLASIAGVPMAIDRTIGDVHVVSLAQTTTIGELDAIAKRLEGDASVRHADAVRQVVPHRVPTDPRYAEQWSLSNINASSAWALGTGSASVTVAVLDTGILPHPDLAGRLLPGYDFISSPERARDGGGRDDDPRDEGDWEGDGECGGFAQDSSWHGLFVAGQIAANANNDIGIAGVDWSAMVLPVRVLGRCGGSFDDILSAILWASGVPVEGAPANPHPAKVINMSLGGLGPCPAAVQEAIDGALAQGTVVVASAGNESDDASFYAPANCSGVITVGALSRGGERSGYSNFGQRVDLSAPGGDFDTDGMVLSTSNSGATAPTDFDYSFAVGTSMAAPHVSGVASLMIARDPNLTVGQVLAKLQGSSAEFRYGSSCGFRNFCGAGALDAGTALASTPPAATNLPSGAIAVVEYYDTVLDHYFITSSSAEIAQYDMFGAPRWQRTGHVFYAWADPSFAPPFVFPRNVCRFYAGPEHQIDSYYFTADAQECTTVATTGSGVWQLQSNAAFWVEVPQNGGACREGTLPVYRFFNNRRDANYRHTIDLSVRRAMQNRVWVPSGIGANGVSFCSLI